MLLNSESSVVSPNPKPIVFHRYDLNNTIQLSLLHKELLIITKIEIDRMLPRDSKIEIEMSVSFIVQT